MSLLELISILVLQFAAGVSAEYISIYKTPGQDVILPCGTASRSDSSCSIISWFYRRNYFTTFTEVYKGNVEQSSSRAARLSLDSSCSLVIKGVTAEDVGLYTCRQSNNGYGDVDVYLSLSTTGISAEIIYIYKTPGQDVILPCGTASRSDSTCSIVSWLYSRDSSETFTDVYKGNVEQSSSRAARLSLDSSCSLVINNITAEDAGYYTCRQRDDVNQDVPVFLSVLTTSSSPPDADPKRDENVTILCSLSTYSYVSPCELSTVRWVDETGAVLPGQSVKYDILEQIDCTSVLTVKRQSGHNRRYTCQFVDDQGNERIKADYPPVFTRGIGDDETGKSDPGPTDSTDWPLSSVMLALRIGALILMIVITVLIIRYRCYKKPLDRDVIVRMSGDEVSYENVEPRPATTRLR
ncbi:titin isoform X2 [Larimichthys crocea]|uniref:titin isoform X2 n=1 Tax=Larimichthys crocea TaxID=215358 RepID=UPI000F5F137C|nr:titin isoform X2 [Larimichthys crocea]